MIIVIKHDEDSQMLITIIIHCYNHSTHLINMFTMHCNYITDMGVIECFLEIIVNQLYMVINQYALEVCL